MPDALSNNPPVDAGAQDLLDRFQRCPASLDGETAKLAVLLCKQMRMELDALDNCRKSDPPRLAALSTLLAAEKPYRDACSKLELARYDLLGRIGDYLTAAKQERVTSDHGPRAYRKHDLQYSITLAELPARFTVVEPNHVLIHDALKAGKSIPGVTRLPDSSKVIVS